MSDKSNKPKTGSTRLIGNRRTANDSGPANFNQGDPFVKSQPFVMNSFKPPTKPNPGKGGSDGKK